MSQQPTTPPLLFYHPILVRKEPDGQFTAEAAGIPELRATDWHPGPATSAVQRMLCEWIRVERLLYAAVSPYSFTEEKPSWKFSPPDNPLEQEYLAELARNKQEDLEQTLREYELEDQQCSSSSSTPTT